MPGRPSVRTAKSSCFGKISTRIGPAGVNWYSCERAARARVDNRQRVGLQDVGLLRVEAHEGGAVGERLEVVERVEQAQQVERHDVVRIGREGALEHLARAGLVAGAQQVHAQVGLRARVVRVERDRLARQSRRLVETVAARGELAGHAVGHAAGRVDGQHPRHLGVEVGRAAVHVGHGREQGVRVLALRVRRERRLHRPMASASWSLSSASSAAAGAGRPARRQSRAPWRPRRRRPAGCPRPERARGPRAPAPTADRRERRPDTTARRRRDCASRGRGRPRPCSRRGRSV